MRSKNRKRFETAFSSEQERMDNPELRAIEKERITKQVYLQNQAKRIQMQLELPGSPDAKQKIVDQYMGHLTNQGDVPKERTTQEYIDYGDVNIARWKTIYTNDRLQSLQNIADNADDLDDKVIQNIVYNGDGKGFGLQMPLEALEDMQKSRYIEECQTTGLLRPNILQINEDLAQLKKLELNTDATPFIEFLTDLQQVDIAHYYHEVQVPEVRQMLQSPNVTEAKKAGRFAFFLTCLALGGFSLILERNKSIPTVAALYLGMATLAWNPQILTDGPTEHLAKSLSFTTPAKGAPDKWGDIVNGPFSAQFSGITGRETFMTLLDPIVQNSSKEVQSQKITPEQYFAALEKHGSASESIENLRQLYTRKPESFFYLMKNIPGVKSPQAKELLLQYVEKRTSRSTAIAAIAQSTPVI